MSPELQNKSTSPPRGLKAPKLREARFEDHSQIATLASRFDLHVESFPAWVHLWTNNPACRTSQNKFSIGWVLDSGEGIAGYLGNIPMAYELRGQRFVAATTRAWVVDTPYRSYSPLLLATYFQQRNIDLFLSTTVNPLSEAGIQQLPKFAGIRRCVGSNSILDHKPQGLCGQLFAKK